MFRCHLRTARCHWLFGAVSRRIGLEGPPQNRPFPRIGPQNRARKFPHFKKSREVAEEPEGRPGGTGRGLTGVSLNYLGK